MCEARVQGMPWLVPAHCGVRLGPGASASPWVGGAASWGHWLQGLGFPSVRAGLLVSGPGSQWLALGP